MARKKEITAVLILLVLSVLGLLLLRIFSPEGAYVSVTVNGQETERISLSSDGVYELNGGSNVLIIEDGCAYMREASCPDGLCIKQGRIHLNGQSLVCLPNRLVVTVKGGQKDTMGVDIISS